MNMPARETDSLGRAKPITKSTKTRISPQIRETVRLYVKEGLSWADAANRAGMSEAGIHAARKREAVQQFITETELAFIQEVEARKAPYKALAYETAKDLMLNGKTESVRMRAVEFLAPKEQKPAPIVQINQQWNGLYEIGQPGQNTIEISASPDSPSSDDTDESPIE